MNDKIWRVPVGMDADRPVQVLDEEFGEPIPFTGDEAFTVALWQGGDLAPVVGPVVASWTGGDPVQGAFVISVVGSEAILLKPDYYRLLIGIVGNDRIYQGYDGWLAFEASPGVGVTPTTYCTLQDMLDVCGDWLIPLMQDSGKTSFLAERSRASRYFEKCVSAKSRPYTSSGGVELLSYTYGTEGPDIYLDGLIAAGKLVASPEIAEAVAYLAAHYVCERQLTWDANDVSKERSGAMWRKWRLCLNGITVGVDYSTAGDGTYIRSFNMGNFSSR